MFVTHPVLVLTWVNIYVRICLLHVQVLLLEIYKHLALIVNRWQNTFLSQTLKPNKSTLVWPVLFFSLSIMCSTKQVNRHFNKEFVSSHNDNIFFHFQIQLFFIAFLCITMQVFFYTCASDSPTCRYCIDLHPRRKSSVCKQYFLNKLQFPLRWPLVCLQ